MNATELLQQIFATRSVTDGSGHIFELNSNLDEAEGGLLQSLIRMHRPKRTIEIGCAYGISSLYICGALENEKDASHTIIDPFQSSDWNNIGITNLQKAHIDFFQLIEKPSEIALPELLAQQRKFDFGFIDGWHTFDHTLIDFFYLNKMIGIGGIIVIDDVSLPAINKLMRYILNYPCYELIGHVPISTSKKQKILDLAGRTPFRWLSKLYPNKIRPEIFAGKVIRNDERLKLRSSMIALQKIANDERPWHWFKEF